MRPVFLNGLFLLGRLYFSCVVAHNINCYEANFSKKGLTSARTCCKAQIRKN